MTREHGDRFSVRVGRDVSGQVVAGSGNFLSWNRISAAGPVTADELDKLREAFDEFRLTAAAPMSSRIFPGPPALIRLVDRLSRAER
jgi:hypothetical protein